MSELIEERFRITIKPITPVFVWSGEELIRGADFEIKDDKLLVIDINKALPKVKSLSEAFRVEFVRKVFNIPLTFDKIDGVSVKEWVSKNGSTYCPKRIYMINKSLVPASSIKGLIRTAFLSELASSHGDVFETVKSNLEFLKNKLNNRRRGDRRISKILKRIGSPIEALLEREVEALTENDSKKDQSVHIYDAFTRLLIDEPTASQDVQLGLHSISVEKVTGKLKTKIFAITFDDGELTYNVKIVKPLKYGVHEELKELDTMVKKEKIRKALETFSNKVVEYEKKKINIKEEDKRNNTSGLERLKEYSQFLDGLKVEGNCFPLKVGMFTGHHAKTVNVPSDIEQLRKEVLSKVYRNWDSSTVKLVEWNGKAVGVGWVKVCIS